MGLKISVIRSCEKATFLIVKKEEQPLTFAEKMKLTVHLSFCKFCRNFARQSKYIARHTPSMTSNAELSDQDKLNMIREIEKSL